MKTRHPLFQFQGFQLFQANRDDLWLAKMWTDMDPHHRETTAAEFWVEHSAGVESYLLRDADGYLFFARLQRHDLIARRMPHLRPQSWPAVALHIQFGPNEGERFFPPHLGRPPSCRELGAMKSIPQRRVVAGLIRGLEWLELALSGAGASVLFFDSANPHLVSFSQKRLGFRQESSKLLKWLILPSEAEEKTGTCS